MFYGYLWNCGLSFVNNLVLHVLNYVDFISCNVQDSSAVEASLIFFEKDVR